MDLAPFSRRVQIAPTHESRVRSYAYHGCACAFPGCATLTQNGPQAFLTCMWFSQAGIGHQVHQPDRYSGNSSGKSHANPMIPITMAPTGAAISPNSTPQSTKAPPVMIATLNSLTRSPERRNALNANPSTINRKSPDPPTQNTIMSAAPSTPTSPLPNKACPYCSSACQHGTSCDAVSMLTFAARPCWMTGSLVSRMAQWAGPCHPLGRFQHYQCRSQVLC